MRPFDRARRWRFALSAAAVACLAAADGFAIEMFTYFGDGSRIGLPSLEVPIEAYPGIPLRSDRLRARRRAMRMGPGAAVQVGPPGSAGGITIRSMPTAQPITSPPARRSVPNVVAETPDAEPQAADEELIEPLVAPVPEDEAPPAPVSPPSGS
jgi:hypothetical protein